MPYVLWQLSSGEWRLLTSPTELVQLAQQRPVAAALRTLMRRHGLAVEPVLVGHPSLRSACPPPPSSSLARGYRLGTAAPGTARNGDNVTTVQL